MAFGEGYRKQVGLLLRVLPFVAEEKDFALKGGTAINLFVRNFPRLSVDIDLTFLPILPRVDSVVAMNAGMMRIAGRIRRAIPGVHAHEHRTGDGVLTRLVVRLSGVQIKIEINPVIRGCVFAPELLSVSEKVERLFGYVETQVVSRADLFAGKIMAALDRQHPRDLFDIQGMLANEGVDDNLRRAFIVYLLSHDRPMAEVLNSRPKDIAEEYERGFAGMTESDIPIEELKAAHAQLVSIIVGGMPKAHRDFLISFEGGAPVWSLLGVAGAEDFPAVKWRQINLDKLPSVKRTALVAELKTLFAS